MEPGYESDHQSAHSKDLAQSDLVLLLPRLLLVMMRGVLLIMESASDRMTP